LPKRFRRRGGRKLVTPLDGRSPALGRPDRDETMVGARRWRRRIESGEAKSITDLAAQ
jgi:hypothetical protein